jgi:hypothetical protein
MFRYLTGVLKRQLIGIVALLVSAYSLVSAFGIAADQNAPAENVAIEPATLADDSNPYSAIIRANVFHLNEMPKPAEKPNEVLLSLPKVNISGFIRHADQPVRALFATVPKDPKEFPRYFNLAEGEKDDILEVRKISDKQDSVEVVIAGTPVTLTTKSNSFVQPIVPVKPGGPVPAPNPGVVAHNPVAAPPGPIVQSDGNSGSGVIVAGGMAPVTSGNSVTTIGGGVNALSGGGNSGNSFSQPAIGGNPAFASSGTQGGNSGLRSVPTRGYVPPGANEYHPASAHESAALMVIDSQVHQAEIQSGNYPPALPILQQ